MVAAHLGGLGQVQGVRDGGQAGGVCGLSAWVGCVNATVAFAMEGGLLGDQARDQMLSESKHNLSTGNGIKKNKTGPMIITYLRGENCKGIRRKKDQKQDTAGCSLWPSSHLFARALKTKQTQKYHLFNLQDPNACGCCQGLI